MGMSLLFRIDPAFELQSMVSDREDQMILDPAALRTEVQKRSVFPKILVPPNHPYFWGGYVRGGWLTSHDISTGV